MSIFQKSVVQKFLRNQKEEEIQKAYENLSIFRSKKGNILNAKEEHYQYGFLEDIFVKVLGYTLNPASDYNLTTEFKNETDSKKADGAILNEDNQAIGVIELKSTRTKDLRTIEEQAFNYKNHHTYCKYVITSNFEKLRFYIDNATEYEEFNLFDLDYDSFQRFYLILAKENLLKNLPTLLKEESKLHEEAISDQLYKDYLNFKRKIFNSMVRNNPDRDKALLLKKSQKLLDRFIFIFFAEDRGLLPPNTISKVIEENKSLEKLGRKEPLYKTFQIYFRYINEGKQDQDIPEYNGELFKPDEILDSLVIDDDLFITDAVILSHYDFETDLDVNILGHIFENSLNDIEEMHAEIEGVTFEKKKSKRKKDGVFYTPKYITQYIVENTIGALCEEKKQGLGIADAEVSKERHFNLKKKQNKHTKKFHEVEAGINEEGIELLKKLERYRNYLLSLKILDPACGSGAFLNEALNFLIHEHQWVDELGKQLDPLFHFEIEKAILENNLYGVDINEESVEIAKLSLWLRTAHRGRKLNNLSNNIKCGNSLIDDPAVASEKAFDWNKEFPEIMKKGGFDVVIGNPPYVRHELLKSYKTYFEKEYQCYSGTADLFSYFYEKSLSLLKKSGYLSFISNTFAKTTGGGAELRHFLKNKSRIISIADFSEQTVFQGITTYPIILILKKDETHGKFQYLKVQENDLMTLNSSMEKKSVLVEQRSLKDDYWSFESGAERKLKQKLLQNQTIRDIYAKCYYGIKTGFNEAFIISGEKRKEIISKNPKESEIIKPFLEGKDIYKWSTPNADKWLILFPKGWTTSNSREKAEADAWRYLESNYSEIANHIRQHEEKASKRYDKGDFWWELRACGYYDLFESPKIIWPNLQSENKFAFDTSGFYINAPSVILPTESKSLLCIVNSKLAWFFLKDICVMRSGGYVEVKPQYFEQLPVIFPSDEEPFNEKTNFILSKNNELHKTKSDFLNFISLELKTQKISRKLSNWTDLNWEQFKEELLKSKSTIQERTLKELKEWQDYFTEQKEKSTEIILEIDRTEKEIDRMVYDLYDLTEEEIRIVEDNT